MNVWPSRTFQGSRFKSVSVVIMFLIQVPQGPALSAEVEPKSGFPRKQSMPHDPIDRGRILRCALKRTALIFGGACFGAAMGTGTYLLVRGISHKDSPGLAIVVIFTGAGVGTFAGGKMTRNLRGCEGTGAP